MGSVSMQSKGSSRGERLSAFVDGEGLDPAESFDAVLTEFDSVEGRTWSAYHLIGDALRSDDLAVHPATSSAFLAGFSARLQAEPHVLAPSPARARTRASMLRRRVAPALAVAAAAATLSWIILPQWQHGGAQSRLQTASTNPVQTVAMTSGSGAQEANIIRDASLDQYLEAHQQFAQQSMMPGSMPLIRAAVLTSQGQ
jgi:sigma-E factor negative regulatory protein RseA